ncbi:MAG: molybdenum cofactor guanylyltransferase [Mangrovibacterium sp.]
MIAKNDITGVVLAGGKSSRFGSNKAFAQHHGMSFLAHAIALLQPRVKELVISGDYREYEQFGLKMLSDLTPEIGALGGLFTALSYCNTPWLLAVSCDMPLVPSEIIDELIDNAGACKVIAFQSTHIEVFPMLISKNILPDLQQMIANKQYRMKPLFELVHATTISVPPQWERCFANINKQEEYNNII